MRICGWWWAGLMALIVAGGGLVKAGDVDAGLEIPPATTHVIGDETPLYWWFTNHTAQPLAFMWEGCCRLNGKLIVTRDGQELPVIPPGPSSAHQFPKAARIEPGRADQYKSLLSDWVVLRESGTYNFKGRYTGVLPSQKPQVPPTLALWRGQAGTAEISLQLLSPFDYLKEQPARSARRGLQVALSGPGRFSALSETVLTLRITNVGPAEQTLHWPGDMQLWFVDDQGLRPFGAPRHVRDQSETVKLASGAAWTKEIHISPGDLLDLALGDYTVFVDVAAREQEEAGDRVPSNALRLAWKFAEPEVRQLLLAAAERPQVGSRNTALKLIRVYLADLHPIIKRIQSTLEAGAARDLAADLAMAGCLKSLHASPGRFDLGLRVNPGGTWDFGAAQINECLANGGNESASDKIKTLLQLRRHLGWYIQPILEPTAGTTANDLVRIAAALSDNAADLAGPAALQVVNAERAWTNQVAVLSAPTPANLVLRFSRAQDGATRLDAVRRLPDPKRPQLAALLQPAEFAAQEFQVLKAASDLESLLDDGKLPFPQVQVISAPDVEWETIRPLILPVFQHVPRINLSVSPGSVGPGR